MPRPHLVEAAPEASALPRPEEPIGIEELFRRHAPAIASVGLSMLRSAEEADDLVQDVFLRAWRAFDRLENPEEARPWLMTIAINLARTRLRRRKFSQLLFRADKSEGERIPAPGALTEHRDLVRRLHTVLDRLPVEQHTAWVLHYVHGETLESVAVLCGCSHSTAKRRIHAAQARIASQLCAAAKSGK
jgi:RNA polymerase sigma-70 factor (ECF subfamily)